MKFQINKKKIIPDINEYIWVMLSSLITVYILKPLVLGFIPSIEALPQFFELLIWVAIIVYVKDLIIIKVNGRDLF